MSNQFNRGQEFALGDQVTAQKLMDLVDKATLQTGAISSQTAITAETVATTDTVLLHDQSSDTLVKATANDLLQSDLAVKAVSVQTNAINGKTGADTVITPSVGQKLNVVGNSQVSGNLTTTGNETVNGTLTVTGTTTTNGNLTSNGVANFTGGVRVNGQASIIPYDVSVSSITVSNCTATTTFSSQWYLTTGFEMFTETITVPSGEKWEISYNTQLFNNGNQPFGLVWMLNNSSIPFYQGIVSSSSPVTFTSWFNPQSYIFNECSAVIVLSAGTHTVKLKCGMDSSGTIHGSERHSAYKKVTKYKIA
jgi:hypothetical protein